MSQERKFGTQSRIQTTFSHAEQKTAEFLGRTAGNTFVDYLRKKVSTFDVEVSGQQNLENVQDEPFILVANHIKTKGIMVGQRDLNITPDAFILERSINDLIGQKPKIVASSDFGFVWHENLTAIKLQQKVETWRDQVLTGAGFIPIKRGEGKINLKFFREVKSTFAANTPIIIFPEGNSYWGHEQETALKYGVALLAKKNNVQILPARIEGATTWNPKSPISVAFREPISPQNSVEEIMRFVKCRINNS